MLGYALKIKEYHTWLHVDCKIIKTIQVSFCECVFDMGEYSGVMMGIISDDVLFLVHEENRNYLDSFDDTKKYSLNGGEETIGLSFDKDSQIKSWIREANYKKAVPKTGGKCIDIYYYELFVTHPNLSI